MIELKEIIEAYDFIDSTVEEVKWADNLLDLHIKINYFYGVPKGKSKIITLKLEACRELCFTAPRQLESVQRSEYNSKVAYIYSWFTLLDIKISESNDLFKLEFITDNETFIGNAKKPWLIAYCENIEINDS